MNFTRKRLAALAATVSALAIGAPAATANAQVPGFSTGVGALPGTFFPTVPVPTVGTIPVAGGITRVGVVVGPLVAGGALYEAAGAGGQVTAAAPQAITLLSQTGGPTYAASG